MQCYDAASTVWSDWLSLACRASSSCRGTSDSPSEQEVSDCGHLIWPSPSHAAAGTFGRECSSDANGECSVTSKSALLPSVIAGAATCTSLSSSPKQPIFRTASTFAEVPMTDSVPQHTLLSSFLHA